MADREKYFDNGDVTRTLVTDNADPGKFGIHVAQDMEPVIELVKWMREEHAVVGHRKSRTFTPVAEMPLQEYERAVREGWINDPKAIRRWMNDPQNKPFRITDGRM